MGLSAADIGGSRGGLREHALRRLAWIEDETPFSRVNLLQIAARRLPTPLHCYHISRGPLYPTEQLSSSLLGGGLEDAPLWLRARPVNPFAGWKGANTGVRGTTAATAAAGAVAADPSALPADAALVLAGAAPDPSQSNSGNAAVSNTPRPPASSATATAGNSAAASVLLAGVKRPREGADAIIVSGAGSKAGAGTAAGTAAAAAGSVSGGADATAIAVREHDAAMPPFKVRVDVTAAHAIDGATLYRIHDPHAQLAGALACHMPPYEMTGE